jgi:hypothetical protein
VLGKRPLCRFMERYWRASHCVGFFGVVASIGSYYAGGILSSFGAFKALMA